MSNEFIEEIRRESILSAEQAIVRRMEQLFPGLLKQSQAEQEQTEETPLEKKLNESLAENVKLKELLNYSSKYNTLLTAENLKLCNRLCKYEGHLPISGPEKRTWCELCEEELYIRV